MSSTNPLRRLPAVVAGEDDRAHVLAGLTDLVVLKTTGSELDFDALFAGVRTTLLETFVAAHSLALQQSLYAMGEAVLERHPDVAEVRMSMPNRHHFLTDLSTFGLDNDLEGPGAVVCHAADRPYGLIEGSVLRDDVPPAEVAWLGTPGFC